MTMAEITLAQDRWQASRAASVVIGAAIGIAFGSVVFFTAAFTLFATAWRASFGWSTVELSRAASAYLALQIVAFPVTGWLLDRWGSRVVACVSIALFGAGLLALSLLRNSLIEFYALFAFLGLATAATNAIAYMRAISLWFEQKRGLAIGLATGAQAIGIVVTPNLSQWIIEWGGWPLALRVLAAIELLICLPAVAILVRDSPAAPQWLPSPPPQAKGAFRGVLGTRIFWTLAAAVAFEGLTIYAVLPNLADILRHTAGMMPRQVAMMSTATGLSFLLGRVGFGFLLDRLQARAVCLIAVAVAATGVLGFAAAGTMAVAIVAGCLVGAAGGGETDIMPYVAGRYFGAGSVSRVFGLLLVAFFTGAAVGPTAYARLAAVMGVVAALRAAAALQIVPALLVSTLPRYPVNRPGVQGTNI
jgi:MFS family permease